MYRKLERMGAGLLARFVPEVEAQAYCDPVKRWCYNACWQCGYRACCAWYYTDCSTREIDCL